MNAINQILTRHKQICPDGYINIFAGDDKKKDKNILNNFRSIKTDIKDIKNLISTSDFSTYGVFMNVNPLNKPKRIKDNIEKLTYIFIDLDDAKEEHNELIKDTLEKYNISYSYNAKSGHGYHFLIPIELDKDKELIVKNFLNYLRSNICDKVDIATYTNERLIRIPESYHKKDDKEKQLKTLHTHLPVLNEIELNNKNILKYQFEQKKGIKDTEYFSKIKKNDIFFSKILSNPKDWSKYYKYLTESEDRNNNFIKNLAIFSKEDTETNKAAIEFLNGWEPARVGALNGWVVKADQNKYSVNYYELLKWSNDNNILEWVKLLEEQTKETFLDDYEIYYLDDEKTENAFLLYYQKSEYFVQKSFQEILNTIYYNCKQNGLDLDEELNLNVLYKDYNTFPFAKQIKLLFDQLKRIIDQENRIQIVFNINYEPSDNKFCYYNKKRFFNTYTKTDYWDYYKKESKYHFPKIKELLMNLCNENIEYFNWFNKWLAWQIKYPLEKLPTAVIFQGKQGSGKGTLKNLILDNIFGENCQEINQTHLESNFNEYLLGKQIIVANEVMHSENRQTLPNVLKNLVTDPEITISRKFRKEIVGRNYTHWIFCTNSDNPIKIDEDDRRYSVFYSEKLRKGLGKEIRQNLDYEIKQYISYLKELEIDFDEVSEPIMTQAKEDIIDLNKDSLERFFEHIQNYTSYTDAHIKLFGHQEELSMYKLDDNYYTVTDSLYLLFKRWGEKYKELGIYGKQNFGRKISKYKLKNETKKIEGFTKRVYNIAQIESLMVMRE